jgi:putative intracellular protease/amidase
MSNTKRVGTYFEKAPGVPRTVAILLFDGVTLQDWVGPYHALNPFAQNDLRIAFVARRPGVIKDDRGRALFQANTRFTEIPNPDILLIPGGDVTEAMQDTETLHWVTHAHATSEYTLTVCTGALLLAATGALQGKRATTIYLSQDILARFGATYVPEHCVEDGKIITAAGTSGGVEAGLRLVEKLAGRPFAEALQLATEYDPKPVFGTGDATKAPSDVHQRVRELLGADLERMG